MSAPQVIRPTASVAEEPKPGQTTQAPIEWGHYVKWGLLAALTLTAIGLISSVYLTYSEKSHSDKLTGEWDEFHHAVFEKKGDDERIDALEKLADNPKVKGTTVHAFVLASLAHSNFEMSQNPRKKLESRADALERAISLNRMLATTEPFMSNPSFGIPALQNLCAALEQKQINDPGTKYYDEAIKTLQSAMYKDDSKEADPKKEMKAHFLFDKLNAQLGRLYWLRGLRKTELKDAAGTTADNAMALVFVKRALEAGITSVEKDRFGSDFKGAWREEAAYIKSLLDVPGKLLPGGAASAPSRKLEVKTSTIAPAPTGATATTTEATITTTAAHKFKVGDTVTIEGVAVAAYNGKQKIESANGKTFTFKLTSTTAPAASGGGTATYKEPDPDEVAKEEVKKEEPKKEDVKKEEPKKDEPKKEEPKKPAALKRSSTQEYASDTSSQHMSYAQIQALLKQGRPALCQCPRCADSDKLIGAKLAE